MGWVGGFLVGTRGFSGGLVDFRVGFRCFPGGFDAFLARWGFWWISDALLATK